MDDENQSSGTNDGASDDTSGDLSGETSETVTEFIAEYRNAVEVVYTDSHGARQVELLRAFKVEENDLSTQSAVMRRIEGKTLIAAPDGSTSFVCFLTNVISVTVRPLVTVTYSYIV